MATTGQGITRLPGALIRCTEAIAIAVPAAATTDFSFPVPCAARNVRFTGLTTTAFGAVTDAQLSIGKTVGGAEYSAAATVKAQGAYTPALVASGVPDLDQVPGALGSMATFTARITQSGGNSAVGAFTLYVEYSIPV